MDTAFALAAITFAAAIVNGALGYGFSSITVPLALLFLSNRVLNPALVLIEIGVPIGTWLIRRVRVETFRRICMSFDAWIVGFGISALLRELHFVDSPAAYLVLAAVLLIDGWLLYRFFSQSDSRFARQIVVTGRW